MNVNSNNSIKHITHINSEALCDIDILHFSLCFHVCITFIFKSLSMVLIFNLKSEFSLNLNLKLHLRDLGER